MLCTARALEGHYPNQWLGITAAFLHNSRSPPLPPYISHSPELGSVETRNTFCFEIFTYHFHIMGHQSRQEEIKQIQYSNVLCQELILHSSYDGTAQPSPDQPTASPTKFEASLMSGKLWRLIWQQF